jgi:hypothetical protein
VSKNNENQRIPNKYKESHDKLNFFGFIHRLRTVLPEFINSIIRNAVEDVAIFSIEGTVPTEDSSFPEVKEEQPKSYPS